MKLQEILCEDEQLDEMNLKQAAVAASIAVAALFGAGHYHKASEKPNEVQVEKTQEQKEIEKLTAKVLEKYRIKPELAAEVAMLAKKHEKPNFPRAEDILAIVGVESSFNPHAKSKLKHDPAIGLTQIRPGVNGLTPGDLDTVEKQIKVAAEQLDRYYKRFSSKETAVYAFNVGPKSVNPKAHGKKKPKHINPRYVNKYKIELARYEE